MRYSDYDVKYCDRIIELGKQGLTIQEMAMDLDIAVDTLYKWAAANPDFAEAKTRALDYSLGRLARTGRDALYTRDFNSRTHELLFQNAQHCASYRSLKAELKLTEDPVEKCFIILNGMLDGSIYAVRAESMINLILSTVSVANAEAMIVRNELERIKLMSGSDNKDAVSKLIPTKDSKDAVSRKPTPGAKT